jgi:hypothetical protein
LWSKKGFLTFPIADGPQSLYKKRMALLIYEIWRDDDDDGNSLGSSPISEHNDRLRRALSPKAVLLHTFEAGSDFDVMRQIHQFHDYGPWNPREGRLERFFTDEEAAKQRRYIAIRNAG